MAIHPMKIFSGSAHPALAQEIATELGMPLGKVTTEKFPDTEIHVTIDEVVREVDVFLVQPCSAPVNDNLMELLLLMDAFRRASAHSINIVIPYYPYARQDRISRGRESISARVVANLLENQGASRVIFVDIHNLAIQGFFNIPVDPVSALPVLADYFRNDRFQDAAIVSPDVGRASMAGKYSEYLNLPLVVMHKRRLSATETRTTHIVGEIAGHRPILIDDVIAGGSVLKQVDGLYEAGAVGGAYLSITHPVLLPSALELLDRNEHIEKLVVSNTIPVPPEKRHPKVEVVSIAPLLAEIILRIHEGTSITDKLVLR